VLSIFPQFIGCYIFKHSCLFFNQKALSIGMLL
jgi:hypothetical protein